MARESDVDTKIPLGEVLTYLASDEQVAEMTANALTLERVKRLKPPPD